MVNQQTEYPAAGSAPEETTRPTGHQLSARNDPAMRDGDSGRGNPHEYPPAAESSDRDVGDTAAEAADASEEVGVLDAVPANQAGLPDADPTARDDERSAVTEADSPRAAGGDAPPIEGYQRLTVKQIVAKLAGQPPDEVRRVRDYERSHRRRKTLLVHLERRLQGGGANRRSDTNPSSRPAAHAGGREGR